MPTFNFMNEQVTTDANFKPVSTAKITSSTQNSSGALSNVQTAQAIPITSLAPVTPIKAPIAPPTADSLAPAAASAQATSKTLDQYIQELTPKETETSKQYDALSSQISSLLPGLGGRGEAQLQGEQDAGLPELKKKLADINAQLMSKVAEATKANTSYEQYIQSLEGQAVPMSEIIGQQAQARKMQLAENNAKAADIGLMQAFALGLQGQVQASQQGVDRAIDLKYQDRESELDLKMKQLSILEGKLTKEENIQKQALERKYMEERETLAEQKAKAKENINLAFQGNVQTQFTNKGGEFFRVSDGKTYSSQEEFFKDAGVTSFEEAYKKGLVTDLNAERLSNIEFAAQARSKYVDANIGIGDSPETVRQKVQKSAIWREETRPPQYAGGGGGGKATGLAAAVIVDKNIDADVRSIIASRPGDGGYGAAYEAVAAKHGEAVAKQYDKVYQSVFNKGASVDAAFNDAKMSTPTSNLTPQQQLAYQNQLQDNMRMDPAIKSFGELVGFGVPTVIQRFNSGHSNNVTDVVLMRTLAKITDPTTGVREEEYRTFEDSVGSINRVFTLPKKWVGKGSLTQEGRAAMIREIQDRFNARQTDYKSSYQYYQGQGTQAGVTVSPPYQSSGGGSLAAQVATKGYDYNKMKQDGLSDEEIKQTLGL